MNHRMRRREFITLLSGAAAAWPLAARTQETGGTRRMGWLIAGAENDRSRQANLGALREGLAKLGWIEGGNLLIELRWGDDLNLLRAHASELVSHAPDVIVTNGGAAMSMLQQRTHTIPIVFTAGPDPVAAGLVRNIARPEGNITGFSTLEPSLSTKWLELLKEAVPRLARVAIIFNAETAATGPSYIASIEAAAPAFGVQTTKAPFRNTTDIARAIDAFASEPDGGLLVLPPPPATAIRETILQLATQHRLPAIYSGQEDAAAGGLLAYAPDRVDMSRRAAAYVDRLLRGAKVADLPVQFPTKFELVINLKTAKALGLTIPASVLAIADEVIE
jgi:putative tryptophan/tyrosine transport system substrate-binding protein